MNLEPRTRTALFRFMINQPQDQIRGFAPIGLLEYAIIFTPPAPLNPILLLFNRGQTLFSFHWGHTAYQDNGRKKHCDCNKLYKFRYINYSPCLLHSVRSFDSPLTHELSLGHFAFLILALEETISASRKKSNLLVLLKKASCPPRKTAGSIQKLR